MIASGPRLLRVRCTRWDQVESFLRRKLRADGRLSMKVPFDAELGAPVTLTLELPNQIVLALDGTVVRHEAHERADATVVAVTGARHAIARLEAMLADARAGGAGGDLAATLSVREAELRRLRQQAAHEVLGVSRTPTLAELRRAWRLRARREHPDAVARFGSAALRLTAEETMIHVTRAYERLRDTVCADHHAVIAGTSVRTVGAIALEVPPSDSFDVEPLTPPVDDRVEVVHPSPPLADGGGPMSRPLTLDLDLPPPAPAPRAPRATLPPPSPPPVAGPTPATIEQSLRTARSGPGDRFVRAVHDRLALADHAGASQLATAAHQVYPLDVRLSALVEIAAAQAACARGDRAAAIAALAAALAIDPDAAEAGQAVTAITNAAALDPSLIQDRYR